MDDPAIVGYDKGVIAFRLVEEPHGVTVQVLGPALRTFGDFVNHDLFGREGVEQQLETARAVLAGTYTEGRRDGVERPATTYERGHNAHHVSITPTRTVITFDGSGRRSEAPTSDYIAFLEELLRYADEVERIR